MLRLTPTDLIAALAGLSIEDRQQLQRLLQRRSEPPCFEDGV